MSFRDRLVATLRAVRPVLAEPGVLVVGSEVPNLLEPGSAASLVVSRDVDLAVALPSHARVKAALRQVRDLRPSPDEPSVWLPVEPHLLEVNFVGVDPAPRDLADTRVLDDPELPLLVFGLLSHLRAGTPVVVDGMPVPVPRPAGLLLEKLLTDRSGDKGERDLLVALALLLVATPADVDELVEAWRALPPDQRYAVRSGLTVLSLLGPRPGMPDPEPERARVLGLLRRLEAREPPR